MIAPAVADLAYQEVAAGYCADALVVRVVLKQLLTKMNLLSL